MRCTLYHRQSETNAESIKTETYRLAINVRNKNEKKKSHDHLHFIPINFVINLQERHRNKLETYRQYDFIRKAVEIKVKQLHFKNTKCS